MARRFRADGNWPEHVVYSLRSVIAASLSAWYTRTIANSCCWTTRRTSTRRVPIDGRRYMRRPMAVVWLLLEHQADVDAKTDKGWTALQIAAVAETQREAVVRLLLEHKEDVDARVDDEWTALHWTVAA